MIYLGVIFGSFLVIFAGQEGLLSYHRLMRHRDALQENLSYLSDKNRVLEEEAEKLKTSEELIRLRARKIGYYGSDEILVSLDVNTVSPGYFEIGKVLRSLRYPRGNRDTILRIIGFSMSTFLVFFFIILKERSRNGHEKKGAGFSRHGERDS